VRKDEIDRYQDPHLSELYRRSQRYSGMGCLNAVDHVNNILAQAFKDQRITDLTNLVNVDRELLHQERQIALERGQLRSGSSIDEQIDIMQRKGNLGMNAILSQSLALARLIAHMQGKELWEILRQSLTETMAKTVAANGGREILSEDIVKKLQPKHDQPLWETLSEQLSFEELMRGLQAVNRHKPKETKLYELLREQLPIYEIQKDMEVKHNKARVTK